MEGDDTEGWVWNILGDGQGSKETWNFGEGVAILVVEEILTKW